MSDVQGRRVEPVMETLREAVQEASAAQAASASAGSAAKPTSALNLEQLARIEDKVARVEEKFARSEALLLRVEDRVEHATGVTGELARQSDLDALAKKVDRLPGFGTLLLTALIAGILAAVFTVLATRYGIPGITQ